MVTKSTSEQAFENAIALLKEQCSALITVVTAINLKEPTNQQVHTSKALDFLL